MDFTQLIILQLIAHLLADYSFQSDAKAVEKNEKGFKSNFLKWHILIVFISSWILSFQVKFIIASFIIALTHWIIDGFKPKFLKSKWFGKYAFFIDQILHISILITISYFFYHNINSITSITIPTKITASILAFLILGKPTNIVIKEIFRIYTITLEKAKNELLNAGKLIGTIERWLILIFIILEQYEAIGFLIAAKSILRYSPKTENTEFNKTEYVLIGTMLSFFIAIIIGISYSKILLNL